MRKRTSSKTYLLIVLVAGIGLASIIEAFCFQLYHIPSDSMEPTLLIGDRVLVSKMAYGLKNSFGTGKNHRHRKVARGDIVLANFPSCPDVDAVKRVVAVPGDRVELKNNRLFIYKRPVREQYIKLTPGRIDKQSFGPVTVPDGHLFLLGDNRNNSIDGRILGFVNAEGVKGKLILISWSGNGFKFRTDRFFKKIS